MPSTSVQTSPEDDSDRFERDGNFSQTLLWLLHEILDRLPEPRRLCKARKEFLSEDILKERGIWYETYSEVSVYGRNDPNLYLLGDAYLGIRKGLGIFFPETTHDTNRNGRTVRSEQGET
jgi:hypothetical protein